MCPAAASQLAPQTVCCASSCIAQVTYNHEEGTSGTLARFIALPSLCERIAAAGLPIQLRNSSGVAPDSPRSASYTIKL